MLFKSVVLKVVPVQYTPSVARRHLQMRALPKTHLVLGAQVVPFLGDLLGCQLALEAQALEDGAGGDTQQGGRWGQSC